MNNKINELMADVFRMKPEEITDGLSKDDIGAWDSLRHMELIVAFEQEFEIELTFEEIVAMQSVKSIENILGGKVVL